MKTDFNIERIIENGSITNELDYERAIIADRKLRLLSKEDKYFKNLRTKLRNMIESYEKMEWSDVDKIGYAKISESNKAEKIADLERLFIEKRKNIIREKLKEFDLTQENLALILGHKSKTHMSELMNGLKPFTLKDLVVINRLLNIGLGDLVPVFLSEIDMVRVNEAVIKLNNRKLKLKSKDLVYSK